MNFQNRVHAFFALPFLLLNVPFLIAAAVVGGIINAVFAATDSAGETVGEVADQLRDDFTLIRRVAEEAFGRS